MVASGGIERLLKRIPTSWRMLPSSAPSSRSELARLTQSAHGMIYILDPKKENNKLLLKGTYAIDLRNDSLKTIPMGQGLVGQCAKNKKSISLVDAPTDYIKISSVFSNKELVNIWVFPVIYEQDLIAVIELGSFHSFSSSIQKIITEATQSIGIAINTLNGQISTSELLEKTQRQGEELRAQQEELTSANESLREQTRRL